VVPLQPGRAVPGVLAEITSPDDLLKLPGVQVIEEAGLSPGPNLSTYVFDRHEFEANLFRIDLPR
jgi:hypothetical protein